MNYGLLIFLYATSNGQILYDDKGRPVITSAQMTGLSFESLPACRAAGNLIAGRMDRRGIQGFVKCVLLSTEAGLPVPNDDGLADNFIFNLN